MCISKTISFERKEKLSTSEKGRVGTGIMCLLPCAIHMVDHLSEILVPWITIVKDCPASHKCSTLIRKVVVPNLSEQLVNDVRGSKFSLLIDEKRTVKQSVLCVLIQYSSESQRAVVMG